MACGGLFDAKCADADASGVGHAPSALLFSLLAHEAAAELDLMLRAGVHVGPVTSGLIGTVRGAHSAAAAAFLCFLISLIGSLPSHPPARYSLFGDVVNTASRMESTSVAGAVHMSAAAWAQTGLDEALPTRRTLDIKGKAAPMATSALRCAGRDESVLFPVHLWRLMRALLVLLHAAGARGGQVKAALLARWPAVEEEPSPGDVRPAVAAAKGLAPIASGMIYGSLYDVADTSPAGSM